MSQDPSLLGRHGALRTVAASAAIFAEYSPAPQAQLAAHAEELQLVGVMRKNTDPRRFAAKVTADVLST